MGLIEILDTPRLDEGSTEFWWDSRLQGEFKIDGISYPEDALTEASVQQAISDGAKQVIVGRRGHLILARILGHQVHALAVE